MKIGLLTQWYAPEPGPAALPAGLARGLAARGHDVRVVTGFPNYPTGRIMEGFEQSRRQDSVVDDVRVRRVALYPNHDSSTVGRVLNYGSFAASALVSGLDMLHDVDALWVNYSPVTISLPMFWLHRTRRTPLVVHALDLWPDTVMASGLGGKSWTRAEQSLHALCDRIYRTADKVAYISPGVGEVLEARGVPRGKLSYAPMWADESVHVPVDASMDRGWDLAPSTLAVVYAGTLGGAQDLDTLIEAMSEIRDLDVVALVAGSGTHESELRERARNLGADNVRFLGRLGAEEVAELSVASDVQYVGLNDHPLAGITMPSKVQAVLASGRPILGSLVGDAASVVERSGGWTVAPGDVAGLVTELRRINELGRPALKQYQTKARMYYEAEFGYEQGIDRIESLLIAAAASRRSRG